MVEYESDLDGVFHSLADATRRDILRRVAQNEQTISELSEAYQLSFAGVAKHVGVLERARLVKKERRGREQIISCIPETITLADLHVRSYKKLWNKRLDSLEKILTR